jgi:hypothetical protein
MPLSGITHECARHAGLCRLWHGYFLTVLTPKIVVQGSPGTLKATYTLLPDRKVMTKLTHLAMAMGEFDSKLVFDKQ